jgi:hypothetical protein
MAYNAATGSPSKKSKGNPGVAITELMRAAGDGDVEKMMALLPTSSVEAVDMEGWTALVWAARNGRLACVEALCGLHGDKSPKGVIKALEQAARFGRLECAEAICKSASTARFELRLREKAVEVFAKHEHRRFAQEMAERAKGVAQMREAREIEKSLSQEGLDKAGAGPLRM